MHKPGKVKKVWAQSWKRGGGKLEEEKNKIKSGKSRQKNNKKNKEKKRKKGKNSTNGGNLLVLVTYLPSN